MTQEEYEAIKARIRKRAEIESFYINCEIEKFKKTGLLPVIPPDPLAEAIMDYIAFGGTLNRERVLMLLPDEIKCELEL